MQGFENYIKDLSRLYYCKALLNLHCVCIIDLHLITLTPECRINWKRSGTDVGRPVVGTLSTQSTNIYWVPAVWQVHCWGTGYIGITKSKSPTLWNPYSIKEGTDNRQMNKRSTKWWSSKCYEGKWSHRMMRKSAILIQGTENWGKKWRQPGLRQQ